jgi:hypothetical protein
MAQFPFSGLSQHPFRLESFCPACSHPVASGAFQSLIVHSRGKSVWRDACLGLRPRFNPQVQRPDRVTAPAHPVWSCCQCWFAGSPLHRSMHVTTLFSTPSRHIFLLELVDICFCFAVSLSTNPGKVTASCPTQALHRSLLLQHYIPPSQKAAASSDRYQPWEDTARTWGVSQSRHPAVGSPLPAPPQGHPMSFASCFPPKPRPILPSFHPTAAPPTQIVFSGCQSEAGNTRRAEPIRPQNFINLFDCSKLHL